MSSQLDNRVWADEFHAYASNDPDLDDLDHYEIAELPIIPPAPSLEPQDFLRARRRYHTPVELENDIPETPQHQLILRDLSVSPPPIYRAPPATYKEKVQIKTLRDVGFTLDWISRTVGKPPTTISYIARKPATPQKQRVSKYFNTPRRKRLVAWIERDPVHRRYTCSNHSYPWFHLFCSDGSQSSC
jgi:hypothetical protein